MSIVDLLNKKTMPALALVAFLLPALEQHGDLRAE